MSQRLIVNWQSEATREIVPVAELVVCAQEGPQKFEFGYLEGCHRALALGFQPFLAFSQIERRYQSAELFPFFRNRLISPRRADYLSHVTELGFDHGRVDTIELLGRSRGHRQTDLVETVLAPHHDPRSDSYETRFLVRGVRHVEGAEDAVRSLHAGAAVAARLDLENPHHPRARLLEIDGRAIGFVPSYLLHDLDELELKGAPPSFVVERINPPPKPVAHRVLVRLTAHWPVGFRALAHPMFDPYRPNRAPQGIASGTR